MIELAENRYGKSRVRLMKVTRHDHGHDLCEWTVQVLLKGDFDTAHLDGDNSKILPTDTMKNTVYSIAHSTATTMEDYAKELADFILSRTGKSPPPPSPIESSMWKRLTVDHKPHPTSFMRGSAEAQTTTVEREQNGPFQILSGLNNLTILKTTNSGFEGYIKDSLTTIPETKDRIFGHCHARPMALHFIPPRLRRLRAPKYARPCCAPSPTTKANPFSKLSTPWPKALSKMYPKSPTSKSQCQTSTASSSTSPASARTTPTRSSSPPTNPAAISKPASKENK